MDVSTFKLLSALLTFAIAFAGVRLPWLLIQHTAALSLARMLEVGVMLGGGLLHLLPEAAEVIETEFPWAYCLFGVGLLAPLAVETLLLAQHQHALPSVESCRLQKVPGEDAAEHFHGLR
jgi:hypothetical protein